MNVYMYSNKNYYYDDDDESGIARITHSHERPWL